MSASPRLLVTSLMSFAVLGGVAFSETAPRDDAAVEFFESKVRPILVGNCYACHSADTKPAGGLRVDDRKGLLEGGDTGPGVVPHDPEKSLILRRIKQADAKRRMPREAEALSPEQVAILTQWIKDGAAWPAVKVPASLGKPNPTYDALKKEHWAWQPLRDPKAPAVKDETWARDDIDRFLLARLESEKLAPVADADKVTLLRRVTFDLIGLPPTPAEIEAFVADSSPDAFTKVVDRLLASSQFGERWGRHWLDVARYGESTGPSRNIPYPFAWKYRDYVINSVNADIPFDRFILEQVAGDLLPSTSNDERNRLVTATGFLGLGVKDVNQRFKVRFVMDNVDEQIDVVSRSFLGLTVSCARCHDHKFDPIPTTDYYALAGIFTSTDNRAGVKNRMGGAGLDYYVPSMLVTLAGELAPPPADKVKDLEAKVAEAKKAWDGIRGTPEGLAKGANGQPKQRPYRLKYERLQAEFLELTDPAARGHAVHGVSDSKVVSDTEVRLRGEAERLGPVVPRGFLTAFEVKDAPAVNPQQSGRLELARWLSSPNNPLVPRVVANRVWKHLFGQGIVSTVDNFGVNGDLPSHPELLDHLASRLVRENWSLKRLVRAVVLTRAYQLSSSSTPAHVAADPANHLVWRHAPRRLDAEELRDAILASSGKLDPNKPAKAVVQDFKMIEIRDNGPEAKHVRDQAEASTARSVYLPLLRGITPQSLEAFDPVDQTLVSGQRDATTVPSQALFLLNSSFVRKYSLALAEKLLADDSSETNRVAAAYRLVLGREPASAEVARAESFLSTIESENHDLIVKPTPASTPAVTVAANKSKGVPTSEQLANPDEADQTGEAVVEEVVQPKDARSAAWLAFVQALYGSAEFRFLR